MKARNPRGPALAVVISSIPALLSGLLSNMATNTLQVANLVVVWIVLGVTFLVSLPVTLYLFRHENSPPLEPPTAL